MYNKNMFVNHPVYQDYSCDPTTGEVKLKRGKITKGNLNSTGYMCFSMPKINYYVHRFIWECVNGVIEDNKVIDHINNNKTDNKISNLQLVTQQENCFKSAKNRDYNFLKDNHKNKKKIKATNLITGEESIYKSFYSCSKSLGVNAGVISMCCQGLNRVKSGKSKITGESFSFTYI